MKKLILENWEAKLMALLAASIVWFLVKKTIDTSKTNHKPLLTMPHVMP